MFIVVDMTLSGRLVNEEDIQQGAVTADTYLTYCRAAGGFIVCGLVLISFAVPVACSAFTDWWLSRWVVYVSTLCLVDLSVSFQFHPLGVDK